MLATKAAATHILLQDWRNYHESSEYKEYRERCRKDRDDPAKADEV